AAGRLSNVGVELAQTGLQVGDLFLDTRQGAFDPRHQACLGLCRGVPSGKFRCAALGFEQLPPSDGGFQSCVARRRLIARDAESKSATSVDGPERAEPLWLDSQPPRCALCTNL